MNQSLKLTDIKNELTDVTSSNREKIPMVKQESDCLIQSEIHIKTEPQENENELSVIPSTSHYMCTNYNIKFETKEPLIKIKCEDLANGVFQDPLDISSKIKVEEKFPIDLDSKPKIKTEPTKEDNDGNFLKTNNNDSHGRGFSCQDKMLIKNYLVSKTKKYICNECNKTFRQKTDLDRHIRIHTGEKPFKCDVCKKSFNLKGNLDTHMLIHIGEKPNECDVCKKVFSQRAHLDSHKFIHSGLKSFQCKECNKSFTHKHNLERHKRIHTGDKPYACDLCGTAFLQKTDLTKHKRIHTGEKPYSCDICNKSFAQKSNLNQHKKIHKNY